MKIFITNKNEHWGRQQTENCFEVTMSIYDGAEIWKLVGIYVPMCLATIVQKGHCRFYKDDDLLTLPNVNG